MCSVDIVQSSQRLTGLESCRTSQRNPDTRAQLQTGYGIVTVGNKEWSDCQQTFCGVQCTVYLLHCAQLQVSAP